MHWKYEWVAELPQDVYEVLVQMIKEDADKHEDAE